MVIGEEAAGETESREGANSYFKQKGKHKREKRVGREADSVLFGEGHTASPPMGGDC